MLLPAPLPPNPAPGLGVLGTMRAVLTFLSLLMFLGCAAPREGAPAAANPEADPFADMRPSGDPHFSTDERRIVAAAQAYLEKHHQGPLDARYRVERTKDGYEVFAMFIGGYENGRPLYYPGGHGIVVLRPDGSFIRYIPGA